jgi:hypothetical protein
MRAHQARLMITDTEQLKEITKWRWLLIWSRPVQLDLPSVPTDHSSRLQSILDRSMNACGCQEGAVGLVAGVLLAAYLWRSSYLTHFLGWSQAGLIFCLLSGGALVGKVVGLVRARIRLRRSIKEFRHAVEE